MFETRREIGTQIIFKVALQSLGNKITEEEMMKGRYLLFCTKEKKIAKFQDRDIF